MADFDRITRDPEVMAGKACIRGLRITVSTVVGQIGAGYSIDQVLVDYPYLEREDVLQALQYAASWQGSAKSSSKDLHMNRQILLRIRPQHRRQL